MHKRPGVLTEEEKDLDLLRFALKKSGVRSGEYFISADEYDELPAGYSESGNGIVKHNGNWTVYIYDRANRFQISIHETIYTAVVEHYWRCTNPPTQYDYREEWEKETGL